ncbi:DUF6777 domain-containing protein [Streptomyces sp. NPDC051954]|uniref:DUF6777 domain-containing protein n=1 Tax=Streptomyces sp. NPDC051954 TaxID=3155524 RepID=UPI00343F8D31
MSAEPPSSGRPTGPPSGPLSGPSQPPGPPSQPPGGDGETPEPHRPWWRSAPRVAILTAVVVAAVVLGIVFTRPDGGSGKGSEVFLQAAGKTGPDPFTESSATDSSAPPVSASPTESAPSNAVRGVDGGAPGLYGGTQNVASCDVEKQIKALQADPDKNRAFASVAGVDPSGVPAYLRSLTPVQLRMDTRVTNHGYRDGAATSYQAVLQSGTAVLVDDRGVPRVRCACGNPLTPPVAQSSTPEQTGDSWPSYRASNVVVVAPSTTIINIFVVYDPERGDWFARRRGDTGEKDRKTDPPVRPTPSVSVSTSPSGESPSACESATTCPPTSTAPSSESPSSESPSSESPSSNSPSTESSSPETPSSEAESGAETSAEPPSSESSSAAQSSLAPDTTSTPETLTS